MEPLTSPLSGSEVIAESAISLDEGKASKKSKKHKKEKKTVNPADLLKLHQLSQGDSVSYPVDGDTVQIHYKGHVLGVESEFDNSYYRKLPLTFTLGRGEVIKGWEEGIKQMSKYERCELTIHHEWAYGLVGCAPLIPPNATLVFEIELLGFMPPPERLVSKPILLIPATI